VLAQQAAFPVEVVVHDDGIHGHTPTQPHPPAKDGPRRPAPGSRRSPSARSGPRTARGYSEIRRGLP
jgi:hypothetical protein